MSAPPSFPEVSVIIPTHQRPRSLSKAVNSALRQTLDDIEIIVIFDGPDASGRLALERIEDSRLRIFEQPHQGQGAATNCGIDKAQAPWIALLDDDDEWFPEKLKLQHETALASCHVLPVIGCRVLVHDGSNTCVWPHRTPERGEPIGNYLFRRKNWFFGEALFQTSTIFAPTSLFRKHPLESCHSDWDWLLRVGNEDQVGFEFVREQQPLSCWANDSQRPRASRSEGWKESFAWAQNSRRLLSAPAYSALLLNTVSGRAREERAWKAIWPLLRETSQQGKIDWSDAVIFAGIWLVPPRCRRILNRIRIPSFFENSKG